MLEESPPMTARERTAVTSECCTCESPTKARSASSVWGKAYFTDSSSHGVSHCTPSGVRCTPSLRTLMPSTLAV